MMRGIQSVPPTEIRFAPVTSKPIAKSSSRRESRQGKHPLDSLAVGIVLLILLLLVRWVGTVLHPPVHLEQFPPLVMSGGDPYVRALMRTISASESNGADPYGLLYGGEQVQILSQHPDRCIEIVSGPNRGRCTTAAGRYQFLTSTWLEKARKYHPASTGTYNLSDYSFKPEFQDEVVYAWLTDRQAWDTDLVKLLRQNKLKQVLKLLSPIWTSLGYGIENNIMTPHLQDIYQQILTQELAQKQASRRQLSPAIR